MKEDTLSLHYAEETLTAVLRGELDHHSVSPVRVRIDEELYRMRPRMVVIDIGEVEFMDSAGLGLIMGRLAKIRELGGELTVARPSARAVKMLKMAGLDRLIAKERNENT